MDYVQLARLPLFRGVSPEELERIFGTLRIREERFDKGEMLAMQDEPVNRLIILLRGSVKGEMTDPSEN